MDAWATMMGSSSMQKAGRFKWLLLALAGPLLIFGFMTSGIGEIFARTLPVAQSAGSQKGSSAGACTRNSQGPSFGSSIVIGSNDVVCGDFTSFGGTIEVRGEMRGNVTAFNSNVILDGVVNGNMTLFGGTIALSKSSQVNGHIDLYGTRQLNEQSTLHDGTITDHANHPWFPRRIGEFSFPFLSLLIWVVVGLALITFLPEHVMFVRTTATTKTRRSIMIGLLSILLAPAVLVVLVSLILPIPLALILVLGFVVAWALGTVAIGWIVGERMLRSLAPQYNTRLKAVVVGTAVLVLLGAIPYIGWLISIGVGLLGLGAVFLSRFGTRLYSQPRQPLTL
jgi:hypothetical protein